MRTDILEKKEDILKWIEENQSKAFIARELKCKQETLNNYLKKMNIEYEGNQSGKGTHKNSGNKKMTFEEYLANSKDIQTNKVRKQIWLHNFIFEKSNPNNVIDHIDHNTLNNAKSNLREVSKEQNAQNISSTLNSITHCRNVTIEDGKYRVRIGGKSFGRYNTLEEAKQVAERKRRNIFPLSSELDNKITL